MGYETIFMMHPEFDLSRILLVNKHCFAIKDAVDASGVKIGTETVHESDASPKHWQMKRYCSWVHSTVCRL